MKKWQFWIDRGGTFTDIVAQQPNGKIITHKLLSENPTQYPDAAIQGIRDCFGIMQDQLIPVDQIEVVRMGTTVATNALLEHKGEPLLLLTTRGFKDALQIAYQQRPDLFALDIKLPEMLYSKVVEVDERIDAKGNVLQSLHIHAVKEQLQLAYQRGLRSVAILLMHGYQYQQHEKQLAEIAKAIGFTQISTSHETSPLIKFISRGDTTVIDAYLSPILRRYVEQVAKELPNVSLHFMQSSGGLTHADKFQGKDAILSGPAGGVVGMVQTAKAAGFDKLIGFDMGGTSTDVCHYNGEYERTLESQIAGFRIRAPMMQIHTVAAGGGSVLHFDGSRLRVGPDSAGANPGPAAYRNGGELTVTDCNVMLGNLQPEHLPAIFGKNADQPLDVGIVEKKFKAFADEITQATGKPHTAESVAKGFLAIAVENMANAIKKISVQRGYDISDYTLVCFGGAGGQHACLVADALGMEKIYLHPYAGVLSAYGMGLADIREIINCSIEKKLSKKLIPKLDSKFNELEASCKIDKHTKDPTKISSIRRIICRYTGSDTGLSLLFTNHDDIQEQFQQKYKQQFGFISTEKALIAERIEAEIVVKPSSQEASRRRSSHSNGSKALASPASRKVIARHNLKQDDIVQAPTIITESTGTTVLQKGWQAKTLADNSLLLTRYQARENTHAIGTQVDPIMLEIFNNLFMSIAEQMGFVLEQTAVSVNIKERLDFSCAIFDPSGNLVANAPHMPVHLGSMSESIKTIIKENTDTMQAGDAFMLNAPYNGGTHLPDITIIKPIFDDTKKHVIFYVASRGHHADIGGITPGSVPPNSKTVNEEGILIDNFLIVKQGAFQEKAIRELLSSGDYPARNIDMNIADFKAQLASCEKGATELNKIILQYSLPTVQAYMNHVQDNAEESVRRVISKLHNGQFCYKMDDGNQICVNISVDQTARTAIIDFTGTSPQHRGNLNAPTAITKAAVLYVFRCLVQDNIPLNQGCLKPLDIIIPDNCLLNPKYPAAVVAGNVETSQYVVDTLFGALGIMAASQGTMNNVTWGNKQYQYYETLCGGAGATPNANGTSAVHTHMTNSRLTDPEILEQRFPVLLEEFSIRKGSGGKGRHNGGDGVIRKTRFLEPMTANILSGHRHVAPYGMAGGENGQCGENYLIRANGQKNKLSETEQVEVDKGDVLIINTPSGGGFGA